MTALSAVTLAACGQAPLATACTQELAIRLDPAEIAIDVGSDFQPTVELYSCGGRDHLQDLVRWHSEDPTVVRVDSMTGRSTAIAPGSTRIIPTGERYGRLLPVVVTVR